MLKWYERISTVLFVSLGYMAIATPAAWMSGNSEFVFYCLVMIALGALVGLVHWHVRLSITVLWGLSFWGAMHMAGGLVHVPASWPTAGDSSVLYSWWLIPKYLKYDHMVHTFGFAMTTVVCWQSLCKMAGPIRPSYGAMLLCGAAGMGFGALNEIVEFIATLMVPDTNVGGYINTGWDLVSNLVGAVLACTWIKWRYAVQRVSRPAVELD